MSRCMAWMGASISMNRWSYEPGARTRRVGVKPRGSRRACMGDFTKAYVTACVSLENGLLDNRAGSRKPGRKHSISGLCAVVP